MVFSQFALWSIISHLGSASLMLPTWAIATTWLWIFGQKKAACVWLLSLTLAVLITLVSKIMFFGWGIGIAALDFTGVSGHALLATSILPVFFSWILASDQRCFRFAGAFFGLLLGAVVGMSRVAIGVHSNSEVVAAWVIGLCVSCVAICAIKKPIQRPWYALLAPPVLFWAMSVVPANYLPTHDLEVKLSLLLSGHDKPFLRSSLRPAMPAKSK